MTEDPGAAADESSPADATSPAGEDAAKAKLTRAQRLEAKAARLREADERRAAAAAAGKPVAPRRMTIAVATLAAVAVVLATLLVLTFVGWLHRGDAIDRDRARTAAGQAAVAEAKDFALDFGTYDYRHLPADFSEVSKKMTPGFAKSYLETSTKLTPAIAQYKTQVTARIQTFGLKSSSSDRAVVVVVLDQTVTTSESKTPRLDRNRLEVYLVRSKGKWLVAQMLAK